LVAKNISLMGTLGLKNYQDAVVAARILEANRLPFDQVVSHQLPLDRVGDVIEAQNAWTMSLSARTISRCANDCARLPQVVSVRPVAETMVRSVGQGPVLTNTPTAIVAMINPYSTTS
jgi:hypothetical protein